MDRFFSKLDLRDIKIDPFKTSYPPDAEDVVEAGADEGAVPTFIDTNERQFGGERRPHTPAWAASAVVETSINVADNVADDVADVVAYSEDTDETYYANGAHEHVVAAPAAAVEQRNGDVLKVSARSRPSAVAGAIAGVVRENGRAEVQAIGAGATNQAVKAVAIARDYLRETGIEAICLPAFIDVIIENEDHTAIRLVVEPR